MPIFETFWTLLQTLGELVVQLVQLGLHWSLLLAWIAWWLWGVNWQNAWPVLRRGAWAPLILLMLVAALTWSRISPEVCTCLPGVNVPNFYWQLGAVSLLVSVAFFCGWLQGQFGWAPAEVNLDPPTPSHGHDHGHESEHH